MDIRAALAWFTLGAALTGAAFAQRPDCPVRNAPMPTSPPGKPPDFVPNMPYPQVWGGEVKVEPTKILPGGEQILEAEEGHVTGVARMASLARKAPPPDDVLRMLVDVRKTPLGEWRFEGFVRGSPSHRVSRVFTKGGSVLVLEEWNMAADGASVVAMRSPSFMLGRFPVNRGTLRTPSGCVSASLRWHGDGFSYALELAGPLSLQDQRDLLVKVAQSIVDSTPPIRR
jgi:hypothetical protein